MLQKHLYAALCGGEFAADMCGGKHEKRRRIENLVGEKTAGSTRSATVLAEQRRECGSDPPLRRDSTFAIAMAGTGDRIADMISASAAAIVAVKQ
ncbi:MAG: hypothetical protein ABI690_18260 [Chloroflexota bacterium]